MTFKKKLVVTLLGIVSSLSASAVTTFTPVNLNSIAFIDPNLPNISYVNYQTLDPQNPLTESAQLRLPISTTPNQQFPVVVLIHGSYGLDSRGKFYAEALNEAGIATLEVDAYAPRGIIGDSNITKRPKTAAEVIPDAFGALRYLAQLPNIDSNRIAIMGFSAGAVITMLTATQPYNTMYHDALTVNGKTLKFVAHVANYPVCYLYYYNVPGYEFTQFTGSPVLIQEGTLDDYDTTPAFCQGLVARVHQPYISLNIYPNDTHAWDRLQPPLTEQDPLSHVHQGGTVHVTPNLADAYLSRQRVVTFFEHAFGM